MEFLEKYPPPWSWEYHPDNRRPIALTSTKPGGDMLIATGDDRHSYLIADEEVLRAMAEVPALLAFAEAFVELFRDSDMRPEDECHELYARAMEIIRNVEIGRDEIP